MHLKVEQVGQLVEREQIDEPAELRRRTIDHIEGGPFAGGQVVEQDLERAVEEW
jgi:hypothetical protein